MSNLYEILCVGMGLGYNSKQSINHFGAVNNRWDDFCFGTILYFQFLNLKVDCSNLIFINLRKTKKQKSLWNWIGRINATIPEPYTIIRNMNGFHFFLNSFLVFLRDLKGSSDKELHNLILSQGKLIDEIFSLLGITSKIGNTAFKLSKSISVAFDKKS